MVFEDKLKEFVERISQGLNPKAIFVFGSVAKGTATEDSDLDLMVVLDTDMSYYERTLAVRKCIGVTTIPIDILAFTPAEIEEGKTKKGSIISEVLNTGRVIYGTA
ncbi:MAG: nucleotidyltransferase domain-containing protein [archaeon]|nr:nucleotidyltransferase domain-containing protein [archaeon]